MKVNNKILSIPPYISTSWKHVASLYTRNNSLFVHLTDNSTIEIPNLDDATVNNIFNIHSLTIERPFPPQSQGMVGFTSADPKAGQMLMSQLMSNPQGMSSIEMPFRLNLSGDPEDLNASSIFQHNAAQKATPDIPDEILMKIISITKIVAPEEVISTFPKPEPHCNCVHCQIGRTIHPTKEEDKIPSLEATPVVEEEAVTDEELLFPSWRIARAGEQLYTVTNPDSGEVYNVHLGTPVGCTCGQTNCEHIIAVLRS